MAERYPLAWPLGWPRTPQSQRKNGKFSKYGKLLTVAVATDRLVRELERIRARDQLLSSNVALRLDGLLYSNQAEPSDRGVALYFKLKGKPMVLACDKYMTVADNIAALAAHIEATRAIERHGVGSLERAFAGYEALPSPDMRRPWRDVLELRANGAPTASDVNAAFLRLARERHPDAGGSDAMMAELNAARDEARKEIAP